MSDTKPIGGPAFPFTYGSSTGMSLRQYAAITLKVPDSGEEWLDDMIRQSLRDEMAGKAMLSMIQAGGGWCSDSEKPELSEDAYKMASAMLKARGQ